MATYLPTNKQKPSHTTIWNKIWFRLLASSVIHIGTKKIFPYAATGTLAPQVIPLLSRCYHSSNFVLLSPSRCSTRGQNFRLLNPKCASLISSKVSIFMGTLKYCILFYTAQQFSSKVKTIFINYTLLPCLLHQPLWATHFWTDNAAQRLKFPKTLALIRLFLPPQIHPKYRYSVYGFGYTIARIITANVYFSWNIRRVIIPL